MKKIRAWLQILGFILGGLLLVLQFRNGILVLQQNDIQNIAFPYFILAFLTAVGSIIFQIYAWSNVMKSLDVFITARNVFTGYLLSFLPRYIPGTIWGYISRSEWLYRDHAVDYKVSYQGSLLETISAILANLIVVWAITLDGSDGYWYLKLVLMISLPVLVWFIFHRVAQLRGTSVLVRTLKKFIPGIQPGYWLMSAALFSIHWLTNGIALMFVADMLGIQYHATTLLPFLQFAGIYALAWLFGFFIFFVPAGIGFRELALANLLATSLGLDLAQANILAITYRVMTLACELFCLGIGLLWRKKTDFFQFHS